MVAAKSDLRGTVKKKKKKLKKNGADLSHVCRRIGANSVVKAR